MFCHSIKEDILLVDALVQTKLATSKSEAREFIKDNTIKLFNQKIKSLDFIITKENTLFGKYILLKKGKKITL